MGNRKNSASRRAKASAGKTGKDLLAAGLDALRGQARDPGGELFLAACIGFGDGSIDQPAFIATLRGLDGVARGFDRDLKRQEIAIRAGAGRIVDVTPTKRELHAGKDAGKAMQ